MYYGEEELGYCAFSAYKEDENSVGGRCEAGRGEIILFGGGAEWDVGGAGPCVAGMEERDIEE